MNRVEMAMEAVTEALCESFAPLFDDIEQGETRVYDCCGMPVEVTLPGHNVPLVGCRRDAE